MARGGAQAIDAVAEIDARQIAREDLVLGQPAFQPEGDDHLLRLALQRPVRREEAGLGELLGQRAAALANAAGLHIGDHRPADRPRIDAPMAAEPAILDGDEGGGSQRIELGRLDRLILDRAAPGDRPPFFRQQQHRRIVERLERAAKRCGDDQPQQRDEQQRAKGGESPAPPAPPRPLRFLDRAARQVRRARPRETDRAGLPHRRRRAARCRNRPPSLPFRPAIRRGRTALVM